MNLIELLDAAADRWPQKPALIEDSTIVSYVALAEKINLFAEKLKSLQLPSGARVGLCFPNSVNYVALTYALWKNSFTVVPVPTECPPEELFEIATTMELSAILSEKPLAQSESLAPEIFVTRFALEKPADNHGLNIAFIRFTSGTTNARKGVVLTHETIHARVLAANKAFQISEADTVIWCLPMAHHFLITIVLYLNVGATVVLARYVTARPFLEATNKFRGTILYASPFHFSLLARDHSAPQIESVRLAVSTTCALLQDVAEQFFKRFGKPLLPALGVIELGLVALNSKDPLRRWNSVGKPIADFQVKILSPDENGVGEIAVAGPGIFDAYAAPWQSHETILRDGWFVTGDLGRFDADGFLFLLSRKTAVINLAGRKVFPEEIEAVLNRHPAVAESRVFGRAHPHLGEVVEAEIVLAGAANGFEDLPAFCHEHLAAFKIPARFHVVDALPRTPVTGKIRRNPAVV
ncbi:MAG TPA: class I adenylate-forming enzyme family protein [Verrucomicrobiae bacterium]|nr:class I adenylate-forming enzyme family protein [Verrucomicrobiae bacterium]